MGAPGAALSPQAVAVLAAAPKITDGGGLTFPAITGRALSAMTMNTLVCELGLAPAVSQNRTNGSPL